MTALKRRTDCPRRAGVMVPLWALLTLALPVLACSAGGDSTSGSNYPFRKQALSTSAKTCVALASASVTGETG
jgi:hypothetical protein